MHLADTFIQGDLLYISSYTFLVHSFPGDWTHDFGVASSVIFCLSYKKAVFNYNYLIIINNLPAKWGFSLMVDCFYSCLAKKQLTRSNFFESDVFNETVQ